MLNDKEAFKKIRIGKPYTGQELAVCERCGKECEMYLEVYGEWRIVPIACDCKNKLLGGK